MRNKEGETKLDSYVALGDSLTVGVGRSLFAPGFPQMYTTMAEKDLDKKIRLSIFARSGATTNEILKSLNSPRVQCELGQAEIISITAGGNDLIDATQEFSKNNDEEVFFEALIKCKENISTILHKINEFKSVSGEKGTLYFIRLFNLYNPLPEVEIAEYWIAKFNKHLESFSKEKYLKVLDINRAFDHREKKLISKDKVHPNDKGYEVMADLMRKSGYSPLR